MGRGLSSAAAEVTLGQLTSLRVALRVVARFRVKVRVKSAKRLLKITKSNLKVVGYSAHSKNKAVNGSHVTRGATVLPPLVTL